MHLTDVINKFTVYVNIMFLGFDKTIASSKLMVRACRESHTVKLLIYYAILTVP